MTITQRLAAAIVLIPSPFALSQASQANIPTVPSKSASTSTPSKSSSGCRPESHINAQGALEFTDCSGKTEREDRSKFDVPTTSPSPQMSLDSATQAKQEEALRARYEYQAFSYAHAKRTFDFQYWSGQVIFWVVLLIVFAGLVFSGVQFYVGLRHPLEARAAKDGPPGSTEAASAATNDAGVSEFEASLQGIKLKSSVLGLLILAMSMVFFYLYLKFVYPINNI